MLGLVLVGVAAAVLLTGGLLLLPMMIVAVAVVAAAACGWWALTTRRRWKRRLNLVLIAATVVLAVLAVALVSFQYAGYFVVLAALTVGYAEVARRALSAAAVELPGPMSPPARPWLVVNPNSGSGKASRLGLVEAARRRGIQVHLLTPGDDLGTVVAAAVAAGADTVGAAGGDGTLAVVATVAARAGLPFFCIPTGTRNHFAADLGLDRARPLAALDALHGQERRVDVGTVSGRTFLNNVSLGAYAEVVREESYRGDKLGTARGVLPGILRGERTAPAVTFELPDGEACADAVVLLVGNNPYRPSPLQAGARSRLDTGLLQVSVLRARTGTQIASVLAQVATGRAADGTNLVQWTTPAFKVSSADPEIRAAVDGESTVLAAPAEFRAQPAALRVLVPAGQRQRFVASLAPLRVSTARSLWTVARAGRPR